MKMMEIFQEPTFTAFLTLALLYLVTKILALAVSSSNSYRAAPLYEGPVAEETTSLDKGLRVKHPDVASKVKFIGDDVVNKVHFYKGSENLVLLNSDDDTSTVPFDEESSERFGGNRCNTYSVEESGQRPSRLGDRMCDNSAAEIIEEFGDRICEFRDIRSNGELIELGNQCSDSGNDHEDDSDKSSAVLGEEEENDEMDTTDREQDQGVVVTDDAEEAAKIRRDENESAEEEASDGANDDWEGIERSELEKVFARAVNFVEFGKVKSEEKIKKLDGDVLMELYGLHKVAVEGPCHEPQPMGFKLSARAKWNAWHKLGTMSREKAMEQYLRVLSERIPGWRHADDDHDDETPDSEFGGSQIDDNLAKLQQGRKNDPV